MPNSYFSFKKFTIHQDACAMKVCTDACLQGAWTADLLNEQQVRPETILDIGTGTGLLSLMLAQKTEALIDAIEINEGAASQALQNFKASPWHNRLNIMQQSLQQFQPTKKYDFIISNPPFFENDLKSDDAQKNAAKHDTNLSLQELIHFIKAHLSDTGMASILVPHHRTEYVKKLVDQAGLHFTATLLVKQSPRHDYFRSIFLISVNHSSHTQTDLTIHDNERQYSPEFTRLLKDYYLKL